MAEAAIEIDRLRKSFGPKAAVDDVSFSVAAGTVVGLLGPNGAGKTTVINCLTTLLTPDSGTARLAGHDVATDPAGVRASVAVTGQFAAVDETLTGRENLVFFGRLLRLTRAGASARAAELLDQFGLSEAGDMPAGHYSGGMRRRLDLAASLVVPRPILVLDEPTTGLDPRSRQALWDAVHQLARDGMAILLTTQYLEEADALAERIVVIDEGRVIAEGTPKELKRDVGGSVCEVQITDAGDRARAAGALAGFVGVKERDDVLVVPMRGTDELSAIVRALDGAALKADDIAVHPPTLNDVFFALTKDHRGSEGPAFDAAGEGRS
ncbi:MULTISPECIES: ATP-binding cassette domain-containing protein [Streptomyces]|uniref:ATP-binding cassette domain-containing protein n=1 Tax=Streptomyces TaxID=1883 RepID=UPI000C280DAD|nr:ATP-binding cassette domain-containing protein [Streptomyces sp. CB01201]PJN04820.1 daunorubicin/doxorubicin resistance ABC transporter ATP-binding protein DrrA [Streptomyces sp. CB01201]